VTRYAPEGQAGPTGIAIAAGQAHPLDAASSGMGRSGTGTASARHTTWDPAPCRAISMPAAPASEETWSPTSWPGRALWGQQ
jgi:hypothetical protein